MDSLLIQKIAELHSLQDTLIKHSSQLQTSVDSIKSESLLIKSLPFIGVIIGGLITYFGQYYLKNKDLSIALVKETRDTISKMFTGLTSLNFSLRELAYLEVDSKYQYQISCTETGNNQKRALEEHYNDYKYIADCRSKIAFSISDINSGFLNYYKCKNEKIPATTISKLNEFTSHILNLQRHPEYPEDLEITTQILNDDILNLRNEYTKNSAEIQIIVTSLT